MDRISITLNEIYPYIRTANFFFAYSHEPVIRRAVYDCRLFYVYSGKGYFRLGETQYPAEKGCLFMWQPGVFYDIVSEEENSLRVVCLNFDFIWKYSNIKQSEVQSQVKNTVLTELLSPLEKCTPETFNFDKILALYKFSDCPAFNSPVYLQNMQKAENSLLDIVNEFKTKRWGYELMINGHLLTLLCRIARLASLNNNSNEINTKVNTVIKYIHENYGRHISNNDISRHFNFHPVYLNRLMVKYTGQSIHKYLINHRIYMALNMIHTTGKSITEIALETGFDNINYFSKSFRKVIGISPKKYISSTPDNI